jgi:ABC-type Fe3+ transport system substrate-binding protein
MPKRNSNNRSSIGENTTGRSGGVPSPSRRAFLATGAAVSVASLVGCSGGTTSGDEGPEPPWTTEELTEQIDDEGTVTIYAGTGDSDQWYQLIDVINDEFGTNIKGDVVASDGASISQRFIQERTAGEDKADIISTASNLRNQIKKEGKENAEDKYAEWFETDMDQNFWFAEELPEDRVMSFQVSGFNGGAGLCMPVSEDIFEEQGLDYPQTYNDLFDEQYEGLDIAFSSYVSAGQVGWITRYHADQRDMEYMDWINSLMDQFNVVGVNSHSAGTREIGKGNVALMLYNWPWAAAPFVKDPELAVRGHFTDPVKSDAIEGPMTINKNAPNPWMARFFISAMLEKPVQRRMLTDVTDQVPVRTDLDLSGIEVDAFTKKRLNADFETIGFWEAAKYAETGQKAVDAGIFEP